MKKNFIKHFLVGVICICGCVWGVNSAHAAAIYFDSSYYEVEVKKEIPINIVIDTQKERMGGIEGSIRIKGPIIIKRIKDGDSIIPLWIERPHQEGDEILFSGIIPGGYEGTLSSKWDGIKGGKLFSIEIEGKEKGKADLMINSLRITGLNENASEIQSSSNSKQIEVVEKSEQQYDRKKDTEKPFFSSLYLEKNITEFEKGWFVFFSANDEESGIHHFEKEIIYTPFNSMCPEKGNSIVESPSRIMLPWFVYKICVYAVDNEGNEVAQEIQGPYKETIFYLYICFVLCILLVFSILRIRVYKKIRK